MSLNSDVDCKKRPAAAANHNSSSVDGSDAASVSCFSIRSSRQTTPIALFCLASWISICNASAASPVSSSDRMVTSTSSSADKSIANSLMIQWPPLPLMAASSAIIFVATLAYFGFYRRSKQEEHFSPQHEASSVEPPKVSQCAQNDNGYFTSSESAVSSLTPDNDEVLSRSETPEKQHQEETSSSKIDVEFLDPPEVDESWHQCGTPIQSNDSEPLLPTLTAELSDSSITSEESPRCETSTNVDQDSSLLLPSALSVGSSEVSDDDKLSSGCQTPEIEIESSALILNSTPSPPIRLSPSDEPGKLPTLKSKYRKLIETGKAKDIDFIFVDDETFVNSYDELQKTPLHLAIEWNNIDNVEFLLQNGAKMELTNANGLDALHLACSYNRVAIVKILLRYGARYRKVSTTKWTPLHFAAIANAADVVDLLVNEKNLQVDIDECDIWRETALHKAAAEGTEAAARRLVAAGASLTVRNKREETPSLAAMNNGNVQLIDFLAPVEK